MRGGANIFTGPPIVPSINTCTLLLSLRKHWQVYQSHSKQLQKRAEDRPLRVSLTLQTQSRAMHIVVTFVHGAPCDT